MTPRQRRQAALAVLCAIGSLSASVSGLVEVAARVHAPGLELPGGHTFPIATIGLVLSLDGLHLASAYAAHARNRSRPTIALLLATTALSAGLQAWAAKAPVGEADLIWLARAVALLPAVMTLGALWLAIKSMDTDEDVPTAATKKAPKAKPVAEPQKTAPPPPLPSAPERSEAVSAPRPGLKAVPSPDEILERVDAWLAEQGRRPSKESVKAAGAALELPCRGNDRALEIAGLIRDRRARTA